MTISNHTERELKFSRTRSTKVTDWEAEPQQQQIFSTQCTRHSRSVRQFADRWAQMVDGKFPVQAKIVFQQDGRQFAGIPSHHTILSHAEYQRIQRARSSAPDSVSILPVDARFTSFAVLHAAHTHTVAQFLRSTTHSRAGPYIQGGKGRMTGCQGCKVGTAVAILVAWVHAGVVRRTASREAFHICITTS
jgi:hypothetical protein